MRVCDHPQDFSVHGVNSWIVREWAVDAFADALYGLAVNATLRSQLGKAARADAASRLSSLALSAAVPLLYRDPTR
jgi:hypothetical protein